MAKTGDVTTAWTISLYVVTAAAGKCLFLSEEGRNEADLNFDSDYCVASYHWKFEGYLRDTHLHCIVGSWKDG